VFHSGDRVAAVKRTLVVLALTVCLLAGCGVRSNKPYTAKGTAPCLTKQGFTKVTTAARKLPFVLSIAENGGLEATAPSGNVVQIAFAASEDAAAATESQFKRFASPRYRPHLADVMRSVKNAVMVWTVTPGADELDTASRCLQP
jgi:hypothetical protein